MNCTKSTTSVKMTSNHRLNVLQYFTGHFSCHWTRLYFLLLLITASKASNSHHCCSSHVKVNLEKGPGLFLQLPDEVQSEIEPGTSESSSSFQSQLNYRKHQHQSSVHQHHLHQLQHSKGSNAFTDESFEQNTLSPVNSPPGSLTASSSSSSSSTSNVLTSDTLRYFTLLDIKNPVTVRASLGPLSVKKTLYPSSLLASIDHRLNKPTTSSVTGTSSGTHNLLPNVIATATTTSHHQQHQHQHHHHQQLQQLHLEKTDGQFKQPKNTHGYNLLHPRSNNHRSITSATSASASNELELSSKLSNSSPDQPNGRSGNSRSHNSHRKLQQPTSASSFSSVHHLHQAKIEVLDMETAARQVTPHLVTSEVTRNKPVLRILFHSGFGPDSPVHSHPHPHHHSYNSYSSGHSGHRSNLCAIVSVTESSHGKATSGPLLDFDETIYSFCSLNDVSSTTCVTSTILPASWFPPVTMESGTSNGPSRPPAKGSMVKVSYSIVRSTIGCNESALASSIDPSVSPYLIKSLSKDVQDAIAMATAAASNVFVHIFDVPLYPFRGSYEEVTADDMVKILVPQVPLYPLTQVYIPVVFKVNPSYPISAFSVRIRIKSGLKVIGAVAAPNSLWSISLEISPKANAATVTAYLKDDEDGQMMSQATNATILSDSSEDIIDTEDESSSAGAYEEDYLSDSSVRWSKEQLITLRKMHLLDRMGTSQCDVFSWLLQVEDMADVTDNGRVVWQLIYLTDSLQTNGHPVLPSPSVTLNSNSHGNYNGRISPSTNGAGSSNLISPSLTSSTVDSSKLTTRFDIRKDEIEKLIGITSTSEMLNTAVLTGKQISNLLKIYAISYSGKVGDVTLQSSCHSFDESVIKVSPSCSSIYLDGTEIRGSFNASIWIKYGSTYTGIVSFKIWMPKFPLEIDISDTKLSQIKSWKVPSSSFHSLATSKLGHHSSHLLNNFDDTSDFQAVQGAKHKVHRSRRHRRSPKIRVKRGQGDFGDNGESSSSCRLKYQQAYISVSAKFTATDSKNGRETYYVSRRASFNVDHLVGPFIRVADPRIAYLYTSDSGHSIVEGISNGRTDIQIVSPITGTIIGKRDIKVTPDKESITRLEVSLVTGLNMNVTKLPPINSGGSNSYYTVKLTTNLNYFTSKFQEGFLLTQIYFSDGTSIYLNDIEAANYFLTIDLFDTNALAVVPPVNGAASIGTSDHTSASSAASNGGLNDGKFYYPRVIALAHGKDQLMHVALEMPLSCQRKRTQQLALKYLNVNIDLNSAIQNDHKDGHQVTGSNGGKSLRTAGNKGHQLESTHGNRNSISRTNEPRNSFLREILTNSNAKSKSSWRFVSGHGSLNGHVNSFAPAAINTHLSNLDEGDLDASLDGILPSMTPLEIGIYAVLSLFTIAVMIFVASCMIFTFKGKPMKSSSDHQVTNHLSTGQFDDICSSSNAAAAISMASAAGVAVASAQSAVLSKGPSCGQSKVTSKSVIPTAVASDESKPPPIPIRTTSQMSKRHHHHHHPHQETIEQVAHAMINCNPSLYHRQLQQVCQVSGHQLTTSDQGEKEENTASCSLQFSPSLLVSSKPVAMNQEQVFNSHQPTKASQSMTPITPVVPIAQDWVFLGRATLERSNHHTTQSTGRLVLPSPECEDAPPIARSNSTVLADHCLRSQEVSKLPKVPVTIEVEQGNASSQAASCEAVETTSGGDGTQRNSFQRTSGSSSDVRSLSDSPLSSLDNLSSLLLSSHSLASVMDDVTSSSSLEPSTQLSTQSLHNTPSVNSEDESSKCSNVFSNEQSSNIRTRSCSGSSCSMEKGEGGEKKNDAESTSPNEGYKCKVTFDGSSCHPKGTFIEEQLKDTSNIDTGAPWTSTRKRKRRGTALSSSASASPSSAVASVPRATGDGNDHHPLPSPRVRSNGNVLHLDESYKCNPLKAKEKTGHTSDERANGTLSHYLPLSPTTSITSIKEPFAATK